MSDSDKKIRVMSPKGFLHKANSAKSALGFMDQYRQYMLTGELASVLSPIVFKVEEGNLLPTPALAEIQNAVFHHIVALETSKAMASMERSNAPKKIKIEREPRIPKNWLATILTASGEIATRINSKGEEEELSKEFDDASSADRFCVRRAIVRKIELSRWNFPANRAVRVRGRDIIGVLIFRWREKHVRRSARCFCG